MTTTAKERLQRCNAARFAAAAYKRQVASGEVSPQRAVLDCTLGITVEDLLCSLPRVMRSRAQIIADAASVALNEHVAYHDGRTHHNGTRVLTQHDRERLQVAVNCFFTPRRKVTG